ncbi:hypothetical protein CCR91_06385 [Thiorhodovibrio winogradskyi]|nr:hypothetical protein [Thiorhodovibrio winogradskyi]
MAQIRVTALQVGKFCYLGFVHRVYMSDEPNDSSDVGEGMDLSITQVIANSAPPLFPGRI